MKRLILLATMLLLMQGCSVKENRTECPAFLNIGLSEASLNLAGGLPVKVVVRDSRGVDSLELSSSEPFVWKEVARGRVSVESQLCNGAKETGAWGAQSDSLWACTNDLTLHEEQSELSVTLHKRFCTLWIIFDRDISTESYSILLEGRSQEDFRYMVSIPEKVASVRIPPQGSSSYLSLTCYDAPSGIALWERDLLQDLQNAGFDWGAADLEDARVFIQLAPLSVTVQVGTWRDGGDLVTII